MVRFLIKNSRESPLPLSSVPRAPACQPFKRRWLGLQEANVLTCAGSRGGRRKGRAESGTGPSEGGGEERFPHSKGRHLFCILIRLQEVHVTLQFEKLYSKRGHRGHRVEATLLIPTWMLCDLLSEPRSSRAGPHLSCLSNLSKRR